MWGGLDVGVCVLVFFLGIILDELLEGILCLKLFGVIFGKDFEKFKMCDSL